MDNNQAIVLPGELNQNALVSVPGLGLPCDTLLQQH